MFRRKGSLGLLYWLYLPLFVGVGLLERGNALLWGFYLRFATLFFLLRRTPFLAGQESRLHVVLGFALLRRLRLRLALLAWAALGVVGGCFWGRAAKAWVLPQNLLALSFYLLPGVLFGALVSALEPVQVTLPLLPTLELAFWLALSACSLVGVNLAYVALTPFIAPSLSWSLHGLCG